MVQSIDFIVSCSPQISLNFFLLKNHPSRNLCMLFDENELYFESLSAKRINPKRKYKQQSKFISWHSFNLFNVVYLSIYHWQYRTFSFTAKFQISSLKQIFCTIKVLIFFFLIKLFLPSYLLSSKKHQLGFIYLSLKPIIF